MPGRPHLFHQSVPENLVPHRADHPAEVQVHAPLLQRFLKIGQHVKPARVDVVDGVAVDDDRPQGFPLFPDQRFHPVPEVLGIAEVEFGVEADDQYRRVQFRPREAFPVAEGVSAGNAPQFRQVRPRRPPEDEEQGKDDATGDAPLQAGEERKEKSDQQRGEFPRREAIQPAHLRQIEKIADGEDDDGGQHRDG